MQQIISFSSLSLKTQHVSALDGHLQVLYYVKNCYTAHIKTPEDGHLGPKHVAF
jgi:hypothetical protein